MKFVPRAMLMVLISAALLSRGVADPVPSQNDPVDNPHALEDPDGVPLQVTHPELFVPSPEAVAKNQQAAAKAKADENWLLRAYEEQKRTEPNKQSPSFIDQVSQSRELSTLAGVPYLGTDTNDKLQFKTGVSPTQSLSLRPDPLLNDPVTRATSLFSKPFFSSVTPLPGVAGTAPSPLLHTGASAPTNFLPPPRTPPPKALPDDGSSMALTSPGLVAAQADGFNSNLTLDLPQEPSPPDSNGQANTTTLALPLKTNAERLQQQDAKMGLTKKAVPIVQPLPIQFPTEPETVPITRPSMGRSALADPHSDIFLH